MAETCRARVEDESARTAYSQTFAEPDGRRTVETAAVAQRARRLDGSWGPIDTSLRRVGDWIAPAAGASDVRFSAGGTGPFATLTHEGHSMSLTWPYGALPTPSIVDDTATYAEVLPGADLVVRAGGDGFSHYLVVKTATAAADPRVRETRYKVGGDAQISPLPDGGLVAAVAGTALASASAAVMWDTPRSQSERQLAMSGEEPQARRYAKVAARVVGRDLVLAPDPALLESGSLPVVVDPIWNPGQGQWAYATSNNTNAPTTDGTIAAGDPSPAATILRSGDDTTGRLNRSFMRFSIGTVAGKQILDVGIAGKVDHTWKCGSNRPNYFYRTASIAATPRQSWPGPQLQVLLGNNSVHANEASCSEPNMVFEVSTTTLINDVQSFANSSASYYYVGICACSSGSGTSETDQEHWMRYFLNDFRLNISYNTKPNTPDTLTVDGKACATGANRPFVKTATPTLRARVTDADGNSMTAQFETARLRYNDTVGPVSMVKSQTSVPNGGTGLVTLPAGVLDGTDDMVGTGDWDNDGYPDTLTMDDVGDVYLLPGKGNGNFASRVEIGHGFTGYTFAGMTDWDADGKQDFIVKDSAGLLWLYPGNGTRTAPGARAQIGSGWTPYGFAGLSDWDKDGHQDIIARDGSGVMWLYPGESTRTGSTQARVQLGSGWSTSGVTYLGSKDWDRDTNPDLVIYDGAGTLWGYPGTGTRGLYGARFQLGSGWTGFQAQLIKDVGGDGKVDILARPTGQTYWLLYPGTGDRTFPGPAPYTVATTGTSDTGQYAFRANAWDGQAWAPSASGWCEFEVDTTAPAVPTVTADIYKEGPTGCPGGACGSVGMTGRFTFVSSSDTQSFLWGWSDPPTTPLTPGTLGGSVFIDWTPTSSGPRTLYVRAIDRAGNEANRTYQFYVAAETPALARWMMNDYPGATTLADDTGNGKTANLLNGPTLGQPGRIAPGNDGVSRTALGFDGVDDRVETSGPIIADTSKSFSVAAWVKLSDLSVPRSIVSVGGVNNSVFWLEYNNTAGWRFSSTIADVSPGTYNPAATATSPARPNVWTHLTVTYDSAAKTARIYVNGVLEGTATGVTLWDANGNLRIGGYSMPFLGSIAEVQVWSRMISSTEVFNLSDPLQVGKVGEWHMDEVGPGPAFDSSNMAHDLTFYNGAQIPSSGAGQTGTGLRLDGVDDYAAPDNPVLYTDQSFTVSVWARVTATTSFETFLAQESQGNNPGFTVYYDNVNNQWKMKMYATPTSDETNVTLAAGTAVTPTSYHHLVGIFDAQKQEIRLYVDGALLVTRTMNAAFSPWHAEGRLLIGQSQNGVNPAYADVDEIRVYQGVVTNVTAIA